MPEKQSKKNEVVVLSEKFVCKFEQGDSWCADAFILSPDSEHAATVSEPEMPGRFNRILLDSTADKRSYDHIIESSLVFSPNGQRIAFIVCNHGLFHVATFGFSEGDIYEGKKYERVWNLVFSPDGKHFAYCAAIEEWSRCVVVKDGQEGAIFDIVGKIAFSPDSKHMVYVASRKDNYLVVDEEEHLYHGDIAVGGGKVFFDSLDTFSFVSLKGNDVFIVKHKIKSPR